MAEETDTQARASGITLVRAGALSTDTAQTAGMPRAVAISDETSEAKNVWVGRVMGEPGMNSQPHHHGEAQSIGFVLSGSARLFYGEQFDSYVDLHAGDFIFIPPYLPHIESNPHDEPVEFITIRTPGNIVVNLADASKADKDASDYGIGSAVEASGTRAEH
ncbi:MAG TPA: cupin domain-containing protein [Vicinamibacterales bacterium]|nr:cupin domain-containing protein [Vicinamibacterales bacterium]